MRSSVAARGIAGSTFEHVSSEAGVSRGLLHYYFGTKERLLVEVVRRDSELRIARLDEPLGAAKSVDDILNVLVASLQDMLENEPGYFDLLFELFIAGRHNPEIQREVGEMFKRSRAHVVEILGAKVSEGVISPRFDLESVVSYMFSIADGIAMQILSEPDKDFESVFEAGTAAARHLLSE